MDDPFIIYGAVAIGIVIGVIFFYWFGWGMSAAFQKRKEYKKPSDKNEKTKESKED